MYILIKYLKERGIYWSKKFGCYINDKNKDWSGTNIVYYIEEIENISKQTDEQLEK